MLFPEGLGKGCLEIATLAPFLVGDAGGGCFARHQISSKHFAPALHPELSDGSGTQSPAKAAVDLLQETWHGFHQHGTELGNLRRAFPSCYLTRSVHISLQLGTWLCVTIPLCSLCVL